MIYNTFRAWDKIATILQIAYINAYSWMNVVVLVFRFHWTGKKLLCEPSLLTHICILSELTLLVLKHKDDFVYGPSQW